MDIIQKNIKKLPVLIISIFAIIYLITSVTGKQESIPVNSMQEIKVIPSGQLTGIKMYIDGVLVVGYSDVIGKDGKIYKPAEESNIKIRR